MEIFKLFGSVLVNTSEAESSISKVEDSIKQSPSLVSLLDDIRRMIKNPT